ncbi:23S rRNA (uracil(747)-C(5))-methyltransferase RlmC [Klebsiella pneumoniae]
MHCALYDAGRCRSCQWLERPVPQQLADKMADLRTLLAAIPVAAWGEPVSGPEAAFRNKAKMVVSGSVERPLLGMLHRDGTPVDLTDCPLYPAEFAPVFAALKPFIARAGLTPYNVARKRGELKYLLLTASQQGEMMLRLLRSEAKVAQLRAALPWLQAQLPQLSVITANIQPVHMAIMEGEQEIFFTEQQALGEVFNGVPLWIRPQSFFQTNPAVASRLYATARDSGARCRSSICGSVLRRWGFGLHCATPTMRLTGIEIAPEAIACARQSAAQLGLSNLHFQALDSTQFATHEAGCPAAGAG